MTIEFIRSYPTETHRLALNSSVTGHSSGWSPPREPKEASIGDDEELAQMVSPPPSRWPRIFPSL
jgi:hypothetical protein